MLPATALVGQDYENRARGFTGACEYRSTVVRKESKSLAKCRKLMEGAGHGGK
jgi:hypothetical protein